MPVPEQEPEWIYWFTQADAEGMPVGLYCP